MKKCISDKLNKQDQKELEVKKENQTHESRKYLRTDR